MDKPAQQDIVILAAPRWLARVDGEGNVRFNAGISDAELDALRVHNPAMHTLLVMLIQNQQRAQQIAKLQEELDSLRKMPADAPDPRQTSFLPPEPQYHADIQA